MTANYTVPPVIGQLKLNNGRVATFYETDRAGYERALASGATIVEPPPNTAQGEFPSFYRYVGPSPSGGYYYDDPKTNQILDLPAAPTPDQQQAYEAANPKTGTTGQTQAPPELELPQTTLGGTATLTAVPAQPPVAAPSSAPGVGAGTTGNATTSVGADDNPIPTGRSQQVAIGTSTAALNKLITTQPNQLDQYASYTYNIGWYLLTPQQYNAMQKSSKPSSAGWQLLMQSGGAPIAGRSPSFPLDYYMDDLEIETRIIGGGNNRSNSATDIRFKVVEPNGITLIENLFRAVVSAYGRAQQPQTQTSNNGAPTSSSPVSTQTPNYVAAIYCLVIQFYGYDKDGNIVSPIKGGVNNDTGYGRNAVITKYYPFRITDIKFTVANRAIEYTITAKPQVYSLHATTDRGTVPFQFAMTGQTAQQLLTGSPVGTTYGTNQTDPGARKDKPSPQVNAAVEASVVIDQSRAGVDALGNFTGETSSPFNVVAP